MSAPTKCEKCGAKGTYAIQMPCVMGCGGLMYYDHDAALLRGGADAPRHKCGVCGGEPLVSGRECICGGLGTEFAENQGLRKRLLDLEVALGHYVNLNPRNSPAWSEVEEALRALGGVSPRAQTALTAADVEAAETAWAVQYGYDRDTDKYQWLAGFLNRRAGSPSPEAPTEPSVRAIHAAREAVPVIWRHNAPPELLTPETVAAIGRVLYAADFGAVSSPTYKSAASVMQERGIAPAPDDVQRQRIEDASRMFGGSSPTSTTKDAGPEKVVGADRASAHTLPAPVPAGKVGSPAAPLVEQNPSDPPQGWQSVACPTCGAKSGESCVYVLHGMKGQRRTTEHPARQAAYESLGGASSGPQGGTR